MFTKIDLLNLACELTAGLAGHDRYHRLMAVIERVIPCEAAALLRRDGDDLVPVVFSGLVPDLAGRRLPIAANPRLELILQHAGPLRFPPDSQLADPYDGLMLADAHACARVHACMGCPLTVGNDVIGVLTVDSRDPHAFDALSDETVATLAAVAAASLHTAGLIEALEHTSRRRNLVLKHLVHDDRQRRGGELLGTSPAMQRLRQEIDLVASSDLTVLITGETGVGKELVATALHAASRRCDEPLVQVNCAALPESIAESELFGHVRGAFTGATADRAGKFEIADGGSLFLDEIGELPLSIQAKLLRALQQGEIQRVGSDTMLKVDVRVIAATNRDLQVEQVGGRFRTDLFHRLSVYPLAVAPLRERPDDIPLLVGHILDREGVRLGCGSVRLDATARAALQAYSWPGNVRELEHVLMRALLRATGGGKRSNHHAPVIVTTQHLDLGDVAMTAPSTAVTAISTPGEGPLRKRLDAFTRQQVIATLTQRQGNWAATARDLGLTPSNLQRLGERLGLR